MKRRQEALSEVAHRGDRFGGGTVAARVSSGGRDAKRLAP
jgi:hypothetical protein